MMKKILKILFILLITSSMMGSSLIKSMFVPGWGEINEYNILKKNNLGLLIISKSGETLEVLCLFDILINSLKNNFDLISNTLIIY